MTPRGASLTLSDAPGRISERNLLLRALPAEQLAQLAPALEPICLHAKQVLAVPEQPVRHVYFPRDAVISILVPMQDGTAVEGAMIGNEGLVGLQAFFGEGTAREEVEVRITGEAARMRAVDFRTALSRSSELQTLLQHYTLALMTQLSRTAGCNRMHSVEQRAARWLLMCRDRVGRDSFPLTHEVLASLLGVRRASVSVVAEAFQKAGMIDYRRGSITILDADRLRAAACEDYRLSRAAYDQLLTF